MRPSRTLSTVLLTSLVGVIFTSVASAQEGGSWVDIRRLGPGVNTPNVRESFPNVSADGRTLFFARSHTPDGVGFGFDLRMATRDDPDDGEFGNARSLAEINSVYDDVDPSISEDGLTLYFSSDRPGGWGGWDIWVAQRATVNDVFDAPEALDPPVNGPSLDGGASIAEGGLVLYFHSSRPGGHGARDLYVARRASTDDAFGDVQNLGPGVNSRWDEAFPTVSSDGLTILFFDAEVLRPGGLGDTDIWFATRPSRQAEFSCVRSVAGISSFVREYGPDLSRSWPAPGAKLYFNSKDRSNGSGFADIYEATWLPGPRTLVVDLQDGCAFADIQAAIDAAENGDTVLVTAGTYVADRISLRSKAITLRGAGPDETEIQAAIVDVATGALITRVAVTADDGIHVPAGQAPRIAECRIEDNRGISAGGVWCGPDSAPILEDCTLARNIVEGVDEVTGRGGAVYCREGSSPTLRRCVLTGNVALGPNGRGGAIYCHSGSQLLLEECTIAGNFAAGPGRGGAIYCEGNASPLLVNCLLFGNLAGAQDGADGRGGAIYLEGGSALELSYSTLARNIADVLGQPTAPSGGIYCEAGSAPTIRSSILWGNADHDGEQIEAEAGAVVDVTFSCVQGSGVWPGEGNILDDPLLRFAGQFSFTWSGGEYRWPEGVPDFIRVPGDYRLLEASPAIDAGSPLGAPPLDVAGGGRPCGDGFDMGALERCEEEPLPAFRPGDTNADGHVDIGDLVYLESFFFSASAPLLSCARTADVDGDGTFNLQPLLFSSWLAEEDLPEECVADAIPAGVPCDSYVACDPPEPRSQDDRFELRFDAPAQVTGSPGETVAFDLTVELCTSEPVDGFSLSIAAEGCRFTGDVMAVEPFDSWIGLAPTALANFQTQLVFDPLERFVLEPTSLGETCEPHTVLVVSVEVTIPDSGCATCSFDFADDAPLEHGRPQANLVVTGEGLGVHRPASSSLSVDLCADVPDLLFLRGDSNDDGDVNITDPVFVLNWLFAGGPPPNCLAAANANGDKAVNIADPVYLLNFLFAGGPPPPAPHPECSTSALPADAELGCDTSPECE